MLSIRTLTWISCVVFPSWPLLCTCHSGFSAIFFLLLFWKISRQAQIDPLFWIPERLSPNVRCVLSSISAPGELQLRSINMREIKVPALLTSHRQVRIWSRLRQLWKILIHLWDVLLMRENLGFKKKSVTYLPWSYIDNWYFWWEWRFF